MMIGDVWLNILNANDDCYLLIIIDLLSDWESMRLLSDKWIRYITHL